MEGLVLFGDVIRSRRDAPAATSWLRTLRSDLRRAYPAGERLADFQFTQGDELQGLLHPGADPTKAVIRSALHPAAMPKGIADIRMRWVIVRGQVDAGTGPATQRSGPAFITARERLATAGARRDRVAVVSDDPATDGLLDGLAPLLGELLADLTRRQREIAWPILVDGLRRSEAAARLHIKRATVSVAADRAHLRGISDLAMVIHRLLSWRDEAPA
jgi:DNA-binding CsgD family transcriptional regulator